MLLPETLPAVKILHFNGAPRRDTVYAYARISACGDALHCSFLRFEEAPAASVRMALAITSADCTNAFALVSVSFAGQASFDYYETGKEPQNMPIAAPHVYKGTDEQGFYNGADCTVPLDTLAKLLDKAFVPGAVFAGNVYSYDITEAAFGAAFAVPISERIPTAAGFEAFTCVSFE